MSLLQSAINYASKGLSVIATDNTKRSLHRWKDFQTKAATDAELKTLFAHPKVQGLAIICGAVSGNLEVIDIDCKYGIDYNEYVDAIRKINPFLMQKLVVVETISKGYHLYYRCEKIEGNQKLANRNATQDELKDNPNAKEYVLIETRGEAGYVIAPPTIGYKYIQQKNVETITIAERDVLFTCARAFNQTFQNLKMPKMDFGTSYGKSPWDDYNDRADIIELLTRHGWTEVETKGERIFFKRPGAKSFTSANYHTGKKIFYVFTTSSQFENKGYTPFSVFAVLECNNDYRAATLKAIELGYGEKKKIVEKKLIDKINTMIDQGYHKNDIIDKLMIEEKMSREESNLNIDTVEEDNKTKYETFWSVEYNKNSQARIQIQKFKLEQFLSENGFGLYFHDINKNIYRLVREKDGFITETSSEQVKKFIKDYIETLPDKFDKKGTSNGITREDLMEIVYKGSDNYFNASFFEFLDRKEPNMLKDTAKESFFPFHNGIVKITKEDITLVKYGQIDQLIWKSQVNFDHRITINQDFDPELCEYYRFIQKISGDDERRIHYAMTLIGYILHSYKDPSKPYAPILAEETDDEAKGGGTGKGIFFKAISKLIPTVSIDGKNFKPDKPFAWQRVDLGTKLVVIEDCPKNVDFEKYYPTITEGMTIEKKNKDELFLNYSDSPKIAFTTNYSINNNAEHSKRRQRVFEFAPYFNSTFTPIDFFGHKLFDNWDNDEYDKFYNLMFFCVKLYMEFGILQVDNSTKLKRKNIKLTFGEEFLEYFDDLEEREKSNYFILTDEWKSFLIRNELEKKEYSLKKFRKALDQSCKTMNLSLEWSQNRQANNIKQFRFKKIIG
jgi:hypothetical protein